MAKGWRVQLLWVVWWGPKQRKFPLIAGSHHLGVYNPCNHQLRGQVAVWWLDEALLHCPSLQASAYAMMAGILEKFRFKQLLIPEFDPEFKGSQARAKSNLSKWYQCRSQNLWHRLQFPSVFQDAFEICQNASPGMISLDRDRQLWLCPIINASVLRPTMPCAKLDWSKGC